MSKRTSLCNSWNWHWVWKVQPCTWSCRVKVTLGNRGQCRCRFNTWWQDQGSFLSRVCYTKKESSHWLGSRFQCLTLWGSPYCFQISPYYFQISWALEESHSYALQYYTGNAQFYEQASGHMKWAEVPKIDLDQADKDMMNNWRNSFVESVHQITIRQ